ncbi:hypothetical protein SAMYPH_83 [Streptomyces phage Samy]|nr:hypothetical protein [Streptomyces ambofaciens]WNA15414.1 hypothetical protein SAMYPH_83 [Streptomyces phage Samy]
MAEAIRQGDSLEFKGAQRAVSEPPRMGRLLHHVFVSFTDGEEAVFTASDPVMVHRQDAACSA